MARHNFFCHLDFDGARVAREVHPPFVCVSRKNYSEKTVRRTRLDCGSQRKAARSGNAFLSHGSKSSENKKSRTIRQGRWPRPWNERG